jgi:ATP-dependent RNA helicase DeaD
LDAIGVIGLINKNCKGRRVEIGKIDILRKFSFFEVESYSEKEILTSFDKTEYNGIPVAVQLSVPDTKGQNKQDFRPSTKKKRNRERTRKEINRNS